MVRRGLVRVRLAAAVLLWAVACGVPAVAMEGGAMVRPEGGGTATWQIDSTGVGDVKLGRSLPPAWLPADAGSLYFTRYTGDGQPAEGLEFREPRMLVVFSTGPFTRKAEEEPVEARPDAYRARAIEEIRRGAKVARIMVLGPGPATAGGAGVGTTLSVLSGLYPDLEVHPVPPTLGRDECVATTPRLPNVHFIFESCEAARSGSPVVRVDVWAEGT